MTTKFHEIETIKIVKCKAKVNCHCSWCGEKIMRGDKRVLLSKKLLTFSFHHSCANEIAGEVWNGVA